ncbi:nuclear transport factor 2 family protein [Kibdelosporangium philippinense]|uniref:Nuclear transport factor 2 family protein n=1 Tax=Kibdelosporangium philippinense TaxID=211113 RepID=A0ABS8ZQY9_9PSEU|nr:nuclear transport factor 2 family protein [Kibdelosporangium philippinense]MCE7009613.1 nuclear transport factor 2 family protein [Kibdelosporangium philippinense]
MSQPYTPRELVSRLIDLFAEGRFADVPNFYAQDCELEIRFALPTAQVVRGRDGIRAMVNAVDPSAYPKMAVSDLVIHETKDPEVIIAEWDYTGTAPDGTPFRNGNIIVVRVRDGKVVHSRDYHNHIARAAAVGRLPNLLSSLNPNPSRQTEH